MKQSAPVQGGFSCLKPIQFFLMIKAIKYALKGIAIATSTQRNMKYHALIALTAVCMGWYFKVESQDWFTIILCISLVFAAELFNTAIEFLVDLVSPNYNELAGKTKDVAAGAVLVISVGALACGMIIFIPHIFS